MNECPKCRDVLALGARACACGWRQTPKSAPEAPSRPFAPCARMDCVASAICRVKTLLGFADFCKTHYDEYYAKFSSEYCEKRELDTKDKQYAYIKKTLEQMQSRMGKAYPQVEPPSIPRPRQPGEDTPEEIGHGVSA